MATFQTGEPLSGSFDMRIVCNTHKPGVGYHLIGQYDPCQHVVRPVCVGVTTGKPSPVGAVVRILSGTPDSLVSLGIKFRKKYGLGSNDARLWDYMEMSADTLMESIVTRPKQVEVRSDLPVGKRVNVVVSVGDMWVADGKTIRIEDIDREDRGLEARVLVSVYDDGGRRRRAAGLSVRSLIQGYSPDMVLVP